MIERSRESKKGQNKGQRLKVIDSKIREVIAENWHEKLKAQLQRKVRKVIIKEERSQ